MYLSHKRIEKWRYAPFLICPQGLHTELCWLPIPPENLCASEAALRMQQRCPKGIVLEKGLDLWKWLQKNDLCTNLCGRLVTGDLLGCFHIWRRKDRVSQHYIQNVLDKVDVLHRFGGDEWASYQQEPINRPDSCVSPRNFVTSRYLCWLAIIALECPDSPNPHWPHIETCCPYWVESSVASYQTASDRSKPSHKAFILESNRCLLENFVFQILNTPA
jgi:hypothetical protein